MKQVLLFLLFCIITQMTFGQDWKEKDEYVKKLQARVLTDSTTIRRMKMDSITLKQTISNYEQFINECKTEKELLAADLKTTKKLLLQTQNKLRITEQHLQDSTNLLRTIRITHQQQLKIVRDSVRTLTNLLQLKNDTILYLRKEVERLEKVVMEKQDIINKLTIVSNGLQQIVNNLVEESFVVVAIYKSGEEIILTQDNKSPIKINQIESLNIRFQTGFMYSSKPPQPYEDYLKNIAQTYKGYVYVDEIKLPQIEVKAKKQDNSMWVVNSAAAKRDGKHLFSKEQREAVSIDLKDAKLKDYEFRVSVEAKIGSKALPPTKDYKFNFK